MANGYVQQKNNMIVLVVLIIYRVFEKLCYDNFFLYMLTFFFLF